MVVVVQDLRSGVTAKPVGSFFREREEKINLLGFLIVFQDEVIEVNNVAPGRMTKEKRGG